MTTKPRCDPHRVGDPGFVPALDAHTSACCRRRGITVKSPPSAAWDGAAAEP